MGGFWTSMILRADDPRRVAEVMRRLGRTGCVTPAERGWVTVFDKASDDRSEDAILSAGKALTLELATCALSVLVHDGDLLRYWLFDQGRLADAYESWAAYGSGVPKRPLGGDPALLCSVLGVRCREDDLRAILTELGDHADALFLHESLMATLGLPETWVGFGFRHVEGDRSEDPGAAPLGLLRVEGARSIRPRPTLVPDAGAQAAPAQLLPFVRPGSAPEEDLQILRSRIMDEAAGALLAKGGADGFLAFLHERLTDLPGPEAHVPLRALQAQIPFLEALGRNAPDDGLRGRVEDLMRRIRAGG